MTRKWTTAIPVSVHDHKRVWLWYFCPSILGFFSSNCLCLYSLRAFKVNTKSIKTHTEQLRFAAWRCPSEHTTQAFNFHYWPCGFIGLPGKVIAIFPLDSSGKHDFYIINFSAFFKVSLMKLAWPIKLTVDI